MSDEPKNIVQTTPTADTPRREPVDFDFLPTTILSHLNSTETIQVFMNLEKEYGVKGDKVRVFPFIISAVCEGNLEPKDVVEALQVALPIDTERAKKIAAVLKEKVLNPIAGGLLLVSGIDINVIPGPDAHEAKDLPGLSEELAGYFSEPAVANREAQKASSSLEPLTIAPSQPKPQPGMALPPLRPAARPVNDITAPKQPEKPKETPVAAKVTEAPKPFMLHEEKPVATNTKPETLRVNKDFTFDAGMAPASRPNPKPVAAELNTSFDALLSQKKATPTTAKTPEETPKVVHYTSLRTPLPGEKKTEQ